MAATQPTNYVSPFGAGSSSSGGVFTPAPSYTQQQTLSAPPTPSPLSVGQTSLVDIWTSRPDLRQVFPDPTGKDNGALNSWWNKHGTAEYPNVQLVAPGSPGIQNPITLTAEAQVGGQIAAPPVRPSEQNINYQSLVDVYNSRPDVQREIARAFPGQDPLTVGTAANTWLNQWWETNGKIEMPNIKLVEPEVKRLMDQMPPELRNLYEKLDEYIDQLVDQGKQVNPNIEIGEAQLAAFLAQAQREYGQYFSGEQRFTLTELQRSLAESIRQVEFGEEGAQRAFTEQFRQIGEQAAEQGITFSGERKRSERVLAEETNRAIGDTRNRLAFQAGAASLAAERELGTAALGTANIPQIRRQPLATSLGQFNIATERIPVTQLEGGIFGRLPREKLTSEQTRAAELEDAYRRQQLLGIG